MNKYHVKKGDKVLVNTGAWKGEKATVSAILPKKDRVVVELDDMTPEKENQIGKRTVKKNKQGDQGGLIARSVSTHVSNVNPIKE